MDSKTQLGVGLIGCGYQGRLLARAAAALETFRLTACSDPDEEAAQELSAAAGQIAVEESAAAVIARQDVDVLLIATPHNFLQPYALQAVRAGKHVLVEKPMALNAGEAAELETAVAQSGVTFMPGYSFRYFPPVAEAKRFIAGGVIGEIQTISAGMSIAGLPPGWIADTASGGGMLRFFGSHMVDRVLWYMDDNPIEVSATVTIHPDYGVDETSLFQVRFERGAVAQFNICGTSAGWFDFAHICGKDGHLYLSLPTFPNYALTVSSRVREEYAEPKTTAMALKRAEATQQKLEAELSDFAQAVWQKRQPPITVADGRKCLQVLDAVFASEETGAPVPLAVS
jgi:predicted dehydrogenase